MATATASTVPATRPTRNLTLPNEVLTMIASKCAPTDLKNMRLASKLMHQVSTQPFARKKFSRRRFIFTYQSMKTLVDITAHPVFGSHLTCLTFGTYRMKYTYEPNHGRYNDCTIQYQMKEAMHKAFIDGNHHISMLAVALENLRRCHNDNVVLGIHDDLHYGQVQRREYAFEASYQDFHTHRPDADGTLDAISSARSISGYPLTILEMSLSSDSRSLHELVRETQHTIDEFLPQETSQFGIYPDIHLDILQKTLYTAQMRISSSFTRLKLSRHCFCEPMNEHATMWFDNDRYGIVLDAIKLSSLQSISIEESDVSFSQLKRFFGGHSKSLKSLELSGIEVCHYDKRNYALTLNFLRFLRDDLNLTYLSAYAITVEHEALGVLAFPNIKLVFEGRREVIEGVDGLIQEMNEMYLIQTELIRKVKEAKQEQKERESDSEV